MILRFVEDIGFGRVSNRDGYAFDVARLPDTMHTAGGEITHSQRQKRWRATPAFRAFLKVSGAMASLRLSATSVFGRC
jgi:hypothetical protein